MADDLYDHDFYLWTRAQAEALRSHGRGANALDYDHIAEELEDLGSSQRHRVESLILQIIAHLYKLSASRNPHPINHWRAEIIESRVRLRRPLTRSIRNAIEGELEGLHQDGLLLAQERMAIYEPDVVIEGSRRWTLSQILGEADDPLPPRRDP
jgi:hypothetical protein